MSEVNYKTLSGNWRDLQADRSNLFPNMKITSKII